MISMKDNNLSYKATEASVQISKSSKQVAVLARQDSIDMRIIAGTTLAFLPATFVATLFSTTLFNFEPSGGIVSPWIWLYFAISAALTEALVCFWRLLSKARQRETAKLIDSNKDEGAKRQSSASDRDGFEGQQSSASGFALHDLRLGVGNRGRRRQDESSNVV